MNSEQGNKETEAFVKDVKVEYKPEQTKKILRNKNAIHAHKLLGVKGNNLIVRNPYNRDVTAEFAVPNPDDYKTGNYVDMVFGRIGSTSYRMKLVGYTPTEFVPDNGEDIF